MPTKYKLTYFDARAIAEIARQLFAVAGQPYEDVRIKTLAEWEKLTPGTDALKKDIFLPASAKLFGYMRKFLKDSTSGYLVGESLTWADLYLAEHVAVYGEWFPEMLDGFPEIKSHAEKVRSNPALKNWIETRPKTKF
ncbi:glutathione S-transferase protein [Ancylostoma ceylanicum]|uniref:glutathione transferase n=1 Tax=Ancylostoma ceylanicum TaxID=53326 RepID=A0A0D6M7S5_9BILA|nr:glutathione S-transferase protein [Ancylostoma ceylanicum]